MGGGMARLGTALVLMGVLAIGYGIAWQLGWVPGSRLSVPPPVALARPTATRAAAATPEIAPPTPAPTAAPRPIEPPAPIAIARSLAPLGVADAADRGQTLPRGYAVRLAIPAIKLDTIVEQGGIVEDDSGNLVWQTLPFVAVHYGELTSPLGVPGNAVIAGHVVTLSEGNVFRFLYQLELDDAVAVWDQVDREHDFRVVAVKLVPPSDTSVMDPTPDETLTLITCGGTFDPVKREFSDRLIVTAKPVASATGR
jgi:LPXTG-site transpeptidase (sortase) family protein